ncbi:RNA polymerase sigma-70 factor [Pseudobacter ginsenosidimutans]|nr:RNA polymerase sigma-70 factor [Pseudobacter ginsenosidimutans]
MLTATSDIEKAWLREIAAGDKNAFRKLFDAYRIQLFNFVYEFTHSAVDAEEIVQETFLKIWENRDAMGQVEMPRAFIYTIVRNHTYNYLKKLARSEQLRREVWANMNQTVSDAEHLLLAKESQRLIDEAVAGLSEKKQAVFRMSRMQQLKHEEIAAIMGLSQSTVKNILVETLRHIREHLARHAPHLLLPFIIWQTCSISS